MISFEEARRVILENTRPLGLTRRTLEKLSGMILAKPVVAPFDLPRFNNSAVDGYGVKVADTVHAGKAQPVALKLVGTVQAGDSGRIRIQPGETVKILTGAPVPPGVEAVVMQEFTEPNGNTVRFLTAASPSANIRFKGEEFKRGSTVIKAGTPVTPPVIGLLANLGYASANAIRKPKVALISTGNELVKPGRPLKPGQIYDSNSYALATALRTIGVESVRNYHVKDEQRATQTAFENALKTNDIVISLGGVSVGEFDFVKDVVEAMGVRTLFWRIAIKPGKPVYFGTSGRKLVFGLPGNPVSALVTFHQLVQPALQKMMGHPLPQATTVQAQLLRPLKKKAGRQEFVRGIVTYDGTFRVQPTTGQDSHMLGGLAAANCLIDFPTDAETLAERAAVNVDLLSWNGHVP